MAILLECVIFAFEGRMFYTRLVIVYQNKHIQECAIPFLKPQEVV